MKDNWHRLPHAPEHVSDEQAQDELRVVVCCWLGLALLSLGVLVFLRLYR